MARVSSIRYIVGYCLFTMVLSFHTIVSAAADLYSVPILGEPVATKEQCVNYLLSINPEPKITVTPQELVEHYYDEAKKEGVRPDIAFAQALQETGFFRYGGLVNKAQNNYCGLGSVGASQSGAWFTSSRLGVRAHIQHLLAYTTTRMPKLDIVDPRYFIVMDTQNYGQAKTWEDLNGKWAIPGRGYGQKILNLYYEILTY